MDILRLEVAKTKTKSNPQPLGLKSVIDLFLYSSLVPRDSSRIQLIKNKRYKRKGKEKERKETQRLERDCDVPVLALVRYFLCVPKS